MRPFGNILFFFEFSNNHVLEHHLQYGYYVLKVHEILEQKKSFD